MLDKSMIRFVDLFSLQTWENEGEFLSSNGEFKVVFCDIEIEGREVRKWQQSLLEAVGQSTFNLAYCEENNKMEFLIHTNSEVGCFDKIEVGSSSQIGSLNNQHDVMGYVLRKGKIEFDGLFSEKGGRFYWEQNRNMIMIVHKTTLTLKMISV